MNLMKLHRVLIASSATLCLLFAVRELLLLLGSGGSVALALAAGAVGLLLSRYFVLLRSAAEEALAARPSGPEDDAP